MTANADTLARPIRDRLNAAGYRAVIVMDEPLLPGAFTVEDKIREYLEAADCFVALATADGRFGGTKTAQNIADEIGRARVMPNLRAKVLIMKEASVELPTDIAPAWEPIDPADPDAASTIIERQLKAWDVVPEPAPTPPVVTALTDFYLAELLDGVDLGEHDAAEARLRRLFCTITKQDQHRVAHDIFKRLLSVSDDGSDIHIHILCSFLEACARIDAALIEPAWIERLVESEAFQRRSSAAVILWERASVDSGDVPFDQIAKLAQPSTEDWYVYSPAIAALKELALTRRAGLHVLLDLAESPEATDRFAAVSAHLGIAGVDPAIVWGAAKDPLERLAHDADEAVAKPAFELLTSLSQSRPDTRHVYGHFGM